MTQTRKKSKAATPAPALIFSCNKAEERRINVFIKQHEKSCTDSWFEYRFRPTGIGIGVVVKCMTCKVKIDATDYGSW